MALNEDEQNQLEGIVLDLADKARKATATYAEEFAHSAERIATAAQLLTPQPVLPDWAAADEALGELVERANFLAGEVGVVLEAPAGEADISPMLSQLGNVARAIATVGATLRGQSGG